MNEPNTEDRLKRLEEAILLSQKGNRNSWMVWTSGLVIVAILTVNMYLVLSQLTREAGRNRESAFWALCHPGKTSKQRTDLFLQLTADGNREWRSAVLNDLELPGVDLTNAQIESARFTSCNFSKAIFTNALLNSSGLDLSDFSNADFSGAKLRNATFFKSTLRETDFRNADLLSTSFEQAKAQNAKFVAAKMGDAFLAMADLTGADLTGADLSGANLEAAVLQETDLALANLYGTKLEDTDFTGSNWWRARGLESWQLTEFTLRFPPTPNSSESRQRDFDIWLSRRIGEETSPEKTQPPNDKP